MEKNSGEKLQILSSPTLNRLFSSFSQFFLFRILFLFSHSFFSSFSHSFFFFAFFSINFAIFWMFCITQQKMHHILRKKQTVLNENSVPPLFILSVYEISIPNELNKHQLNWTWKQLFVLARDNFGKFVPKHFVSVLCVRGMPCAVPCRT